MKIIIIRGTMVNGKRVEPNPKKPTIVDVSDADARLLINLGKAKPASDKATPTKQDPADDSTE